MQQCEVQIGQTAKTALLGKWLEAFYRGCVFSKTGANPSSCDRPLYLARPCVCTSCRDFGLFELACLDTARSQQEQETLSRPPARPGARRTLALYRIAPSQEKKRGVAGVRFRIILDHPFHQIGGGGEVLRFSANRPAR